MSEIKKYQKFVRNFRNLIPDEYNQIELVDELPNTDLDFYISISNRSDGKSFNYVNFFIELSIDYGIGFMLVARHFTLRDAYRELVETIFFTKPNLKEHKLAFKRTDEYLAIIYGDEYIGCITDLNNATDLKYHSNFLKEFPVIIYDEFLAIEGDYLIDEWDKLKTIYESIDRNREGIPIIQFPKLVLLGNAVNFKSPILANLDIFNILERQKINTMRKHDNVLLELRRNDNANESRNTRAFNSDDDAMTTAEFDMNNFNIASNERKQAILKNSDFFYIKTERYYIKVVFNLDSLECYMAVEPYAKHYHFCTEVVDVKDGVILLEYEKYFDEYHYKKYYRNSGLYFDNAYSKDYVLENYHLIELKILKVIKKYIVTFRPQESQFDYNERIYNDNYYERTKMNLVKRFS